MRTRFTLLLGLVWLLSIGAAAPVRMTPVKIADSVYMLQHSQGSGNSTVVFTDDGVLVFDFHIDNADQTLAVYPKADGQESQISDLLAQRRRSRLRRMAFPRRQAGLHRDQEPDPRSANAGAAKSFNERKNSNDPRNAGYKGKELIPPDIGFDGTMTLYFGGLTFQITAGRSRPQHRRSHGLHSAEARIFNGRSARH